MILLYAVVPGGTQLPPGLVGPDGLRVHPGRVGVVYAERTTEPQPSAEELHAFAGVVQRLFAAGGLLPVRFGTTVASLSELAALAGDLEDRWSARLGELDGCCELIVHLPPADPPRPARTGEPEPSGRAYLERRARALHAAERHRRMVDDAVRGWCRDRRLLPARGGRERLALLVLRKHAAAARTTLLALDGAGRRLAVTGPWPPYSFCEEVPDG